MQLALTPPGESHVLDWQRGLAQALGRTGRAHEARIALQQALGQQQMEPAVRSSVLCELVDLQVRAGQACPGCCCAAAVMQAADARHQYPQGDSADLGLLDEIVALGRPELSRYQELWVQRSMDQLRRQAPRWALCVCLPLCITCGHCLGWGPAVCPALVL